LTILTTGIRDGEPFLGPVPKFCSQSLKKLQLPMQTFFGTDQGVVKLRFKKKITNIKYIK